MKRRVAILMYHAVTREPHREFRKYEVTPEAFAAQMRWLGRTGYQPVSLDTWLDGRGHPGPRRPRPVVITFDDGFRDCVDHALPVLEAEGFTATFYLVAGLMGGTSRWLRPLRGIEVPLIDWATAGRLVAAGFECGSHTLTHPNLVHLPAAACRSELRESRRLLEDNLGREVRHLAYPFGLFDGTVRAIAAEAGYRSACSTRIGLAGPDDDPLALVRVPVSGRDSLLDFACRLRMAHTPWEALGVRARNAWRGLRRVGRRQTP